MSRCERRLIVETTPRVKKQSLPVPPTPDTYKILAHPAGQARPGELITQSKEARFNEEARLMNSNHPMLVCGVAAFAAAAVFAVGSTTGKSEIELLEAALTPQTAGQCFEEAKQVCEKDAGQLWGITLCGPILFADPKTRVVIANQADREGLLAQRDGVFVGTLPPEEMIAGTVTHWAGVTWVMLPWPVFKDEGERAHALAHEMFHRVQPKLGLVGQSAEGATTAHLDARDGRIWLQLEWRALQAALKHSGPERRRAVTDALTFRAFRRLLFPGATVAERAQETLEGLAEYTGVRLSTDSPSAAIERALVNFERAKGWPTLTGSFAYVSGPPYGLLLDQAKPDWRTGLTSRDDLGLLLQQALSISLPEELETAARERAKGYEAEELVAAETARALAKQDSLAKHRQRFVTGPVLIIPIRSMNFQFDPRDIRPLDDLGKVYPKMRMSDAWGILEVTGGALIANDWSKVVVPAPSDPNLRPLKGNGWTLELSPGWELRGQKRKGDYRVSQVTRP